MVELKQLAWIIGGTITGIVSLYLYFTYFKAPPKPECKIDADCPTGYICVGGKCVKPECTTDADCPAGYYCSGGKCVPSQYKAEIVSIKVS